MLNPLHLKSLSVVMRAGSFAAAGRQLGYTGSAVSQQIASLETETGLRLFERDAHGIRPTRAAHLLVERISETLGSLASLEEAIHEMASGTRGRLGLGSFPTASEMFVPNALARFNRAFKHVEVRFDDGEPDYLIPRLMEGDLDVVVAYRYDLVPVNWPSTLTRVPLLEEDIRVLIPRDVMVGKSTFHLRDFADGGWISTREGSAGALAFERACAAVGFTPNILFRTNDYDVVRSFVRAGLGVAAVPLLSAAGRSDPRAIRAEGLELHRHVEAVTNQPDDVAVRGMIDALKAAVRAQRILG